MWCEVTCWTTAAGTLLLILCGLHHLRITWNFEQCATKIVPQIKYQSEVEVSWYHERDIKVPGTFVKKQL